MARMHVEGWAPEYGAPFDPEDELAPAEGSVDLTVERTDWAPLPGRDDGLAQMAFVDGVRRIDARLTVDDPELGTGVRRLRVVSRSARPSGTGRRRRRRVAGARVERVAVLSGRRDGGDAGGRARSAVPHRDHRRPRPAHARHARPRPDAARGGRVRRGIRPVGLLRHRRRAAERPVPAVHRGVHRRRTGGRTCRPSTTRSSARWRRGSARPCSPSRTTGGTRGTCGCRIPAAGTRGRAWCGARRTARFRSARCARWPTARRRCCRWSRREEHLDPRAPQNLVPIAALERELRHLMGDRGLVYRAIRSAVMREETRV